MTGFVDFSDSESGIYLFLTELYSVMFCWKADVCHAYQILKNGGLKDENIIVFMYDDIAYNSENPYKGKIINKPDGPDVYEGVPKVCVFSLV